MAAITFTSAADFEAAFTGETVGEGGWRFYSSGTTPTNYTGPTSGNTSPFMATDASDAADYNGVDALEATSVAVFTTVPSGAGRSLRIRAAIRGGFFGTQRSTGGQAPDGQEGLSVEGRASDSDSWEQIDICRGYYGASTDSSNINLGDNITLSDGTVVQCAERGGWVDYTIELPDNVTQVRLAPLYYVDASSSYDRTWYQLHDIALQSFEMVGAPVVALSAAAAAASVTASSSISSVLGPGIDGNVYAFNTTALFRDAFPTAQVGDQQAGNQGRWIHYASGAPKSNTGPGTNNGLPYMAVNISGVGSLFTSIYLPRTPAQLAAVIGGEDRKLNLRLCLQGAGFNVPADGLAIDVRASDDDTWFEQAVIRGWAHDDDREAGDVFTDFDGRELTCAADGGWVDFAVNIPNAANRVRLRPKLTDFFSTDNSPYHNQRDVAIQSFQWGDLGDAGGVAIDPSPAATAFASAGVGIARAVPLATNLAAASVTVSSSIAATGAQSLATTLAAATGTLTAAITDSIQTPVRASATILSSVTAVARLTSAGFVTLHVFNGVGRAPEVEPMPGEPGEPGEPGDPDPTPGEPMYERELGVQCSVLVIGGQTMNAELEWVPIKISSILEAA